MPEISRFLGIVIGMFYREHGPPHFHAVYGESQAIFHIETGHMIGNLPQRARRLVLDWLHMHRVELLKNWELAQAGQQGTTRACYSAKENSIFLASVPCLETSRISSETSWPASS